MMNNAAPVAPDSKQRTAAERENLTGNMRTLSLVLSVLAHRPSTFAAPAGPSIRQFASCSIRRMCAR